MARNRNSNILKKDDDRPEWKKNFSKFMIFFACVANVWLLVQVIEIYRDGDASSISMVAFSIYTFNAIIWFTYGLLAFDHYDLGLMVYGVIAFLMGVTTIVGKAIYDSPAETATPIEIKL